MTFCQLKLAFNFDTKPLRYNTIQHNITDSQGQFQIVLVLVTVCTYTWHKKDNICLC